MIDRGAENDVLAAFCHNGSVNAGFMNSLMESFAEDQRRADAGGRRRLLEYHDAVGPYIHDNRCRIARYFLDTGKQWLWMLDNDMKFQPSVLYEMLEIAESEDIQLLGAAYWNQYGEGKCYLSWLMFVKEIGIRAVPILPEGDDPFEVSALGMGCTLIHRDVVQAVTDLYPGDTWPTFGADMLVRLEDGFLTGRVPEDWQDALGDRPVVETYRMGEDVTFCLRARRAGYRAYGLPSVVADHYKMHRMAHGRSSAAALEPVA